MFRSKDHKVEKLRDVQMFSRCNTKHLTAIAAAVDEVEVKAGEVLMKEGQSASAAYFIVSGQVEISIAGDVVAATVGEGESIGEMSLIDREPRSATVTALTDLEAYVIHVSNFMPVLSDNPTVALAMLESLSMRLRALDDDHARLVTLYGGA